MQAALREKDGGVLSYDNIKNVKSLLPSDTQHKDIARFLEVSICTWYAKWFLHAARFPVVGEHAAQQCTDGAAMCSRYMTAQMRISMLITYCFTGQAQQLC